MNDKKRKLSALELINIMALILIMSFFFLPLTALYFKVITFYPIYCIWIFSALAIDWKLIYRSKRTWMFLFFLLFFAILFLLVQNDTTMLKKIITTLFISYNWGIALAFYSSRYHLFRKSIMPMMLMFILGSIMTYKGLELNPMASRILATMTGKYDESMVQMFKQMGIGGYDFIYSTVFMLPSFLCIIKKEKKIIYRVIAFTALVLGTICIFQSGYSIAILFALMGIALTLILNNSNIKKLSSIIPIVIIILIVIWIFKENLFIFIGNLGDAVGAYYVSVRMEQLIAALSGEGLYSLDRFQLYKNAIIKFIDSPFLGDVVRVNHLKLNSGHSEVLNYLEIYGIFGITYISFLVKSFKSSCKNITNSKRKSILVLNLISIFIFAIINRIDSANGVCMVALFIAPMLALLDDEKKENTII